MQIFNSRSIEFRELNILIFEIAIYVVVFDIYKDADEEKKLQNFFKMLIYKHLKYKMNFCFDICFLSNILY